MTITQSIMAWGGAGSQPVLTDSTQMRNEVHFTRFSSLLSQSLNHTLVPFSPGGQLSPSRFCRRVRRTSCRSASGRAYTLPRGPSCSRCTLRAWPSASFQSSWSHPGHPTGRQEARFATQTTLHPFPAHPLGGWPSPPAGLPLV